MNCKIFIEKNVKKHIFFFVIILTFAPANAIAEVLSVNADTNEFSLEQITQKTSCNCVAFRFDDIQGYWLNNVQIAVMEKFDSKKLPLTIGIIGGNQFKFGDDPIITEYVKEKVSLDKPRIKIANHGWIHENFSTFDKKTQNELIEKSNERLEKILGITPKVFIPPFNEFDSNTKITLIENNFTHFSSSLFTSNPPYVFENSLLYNFPETSSTGQIKNHGLFEGVSHEETFKDITTSLDKYGFAVVMMHPQEFSIIEDEDYINVVNKDQINELELLLEEIQNAGLKIVFLEDINENVNSYKLSTPGWFEENFQWINEGKITDQELSYALNYLKKHSIVKFEV